MIDFTCRHCGWILRTEDKHAGMPAQCPKCKQKVTVPGERPVFVDDPLNPTELVIPDTAGNASAPATSPPQPADNKRTDGLNERGASRTMIEFKCPSCSAAMSAPVDQAGKAENCPGCNLRVTVPRRSSSKLRLPYGDSVNSGVFEILGMVAITFMALGGFVTMVSGDTPGSTIAGAVVFMGACIVLGINWLGQHIRRLRWEQASRSSQEAYRWQQDRPPPGPEQKVSATGMAKR